VLPENVANVIEVDSYVINFGNFVSGKCLGSTLMIHNLDHQDREITIELDKISESYSCDEIFGPYLREELPFKYVDGSSMPNSEKLCNSWFIENPTTKDLVKTLTYKLTAGQELEIIIVLKAPEDIPQLNLATFVSLRFAD
jgi:hypothetical protein